MQIQAVVVGAGLMGRWHAHELARAGGSVVAVVDPNAAAATGLAARHPGARSVATLEEALESTSPDVVHICTPTPTHVTLVKKGLDAGAHLLVEKPLAPDAEPTDELLRLAQQAGVHLCPVHQYVFQPGTMAGIEGLPRIEPLVHLEATLCSAGGREAPFSPLDETAADILPHPLSVLERLLPGGLEAVGWSAMRPQEGELRALGTDAGRSIAVSVSMNGRPPRNELRVIGARGTLELDFFHGYAIWERAAPSRAQKVLAPFTTSGLRSLAAARNLAGRALRWEPAYPGLRSLISLLYTAIRDNSSSPIAPAESLAVARASDAIQSSAT
jgi:predicted dehydrogenase